MMAKNGQKLAVLTMWELLFTAWFVIVAAAGIVLMVWLMIADDV